MIYELFHLLLIAGWIGDWFLIYFCLKKLIQFDKICLMYPMLYLFSEFFEYMPFFNYISELYIKSFKKYFKYSKLNTINNNPINSKNNIFIMGPHGIFMNGPIASGIFDIDREEVNKYKLFVASNLIYNPMVNIIAKMIQNGNKVEGLTHKNVIKNLKENTHNLCVSGGGFEELNLFRDDNNIIYVGRWSYWIYNAIKYGYDINFCHVYGGDRDYRSILGNNFLKFREWCAKHYIPCNIFYGKWLLFPFNDVPMTEISFKLELPYNPNITKEESKEYHSKFIDKFLDVIEKNKPTKEQGKINVCGFSR